MSNQMFNSPPSYSGVTIQIANPAVNVNPYGVNTNYPQGISVRNGNYAACPQACYCTDEIDKINSAGQVASDKYTVTNPIQSNYGNTEKASKETGYAKAYPAGYYLNNYGEGTPKQQGVQENFANYAEGLNKTVPDRTSTIEEKNHAIEVKKRIMAHPDCPQEVKNELQKEINTIEDEIGRIEKSSTENPTKNGIEFSDSKTPYIAGENLDIANEEYNPSQTHHVDPLAGISPYKDYAKSYEAKGPEDMTASKNIIGSLDERNAEIKEAKKNTKEQKIVALTDEYIMSLENYLNNPNDEIRLMASKEILTRLDEDKDRYDDAALNALLNKMLQDPSKLIRLAALSAFASQLASGNDYTVQLLQNIQSNPNADKEDALQAADILLKMSAGVEVKNVPASEVKREQYKMKARKVQ